MARARKESQRMDREPTADPSRYTAKELRSEIARIKRETRALAQQVEHKRRLLLSLLDGLESLKQDAVPAKVAEADGLAEGPRPKGTQQR